LARGNRRGAGAQDVEPEGAAAPRPQAPGRAPDPGWRRRNAMSPQPCVHEAEVVAAVLSRRWPEACDESLRAHAETCDVCREVVAVAALLKEDYDEAREAIAQRDV